MANNTYTTTHLYVSPSLRHFEVFKSEPLASDLRLNGTLYRRLDPSYYSWLKRRINRLATAVDKKKVTIEAYMETWKTH